jgi:hypothetical protein
MKWQRWKLSIQHILNKTGFTFMQMALSDKNGNAGAEIH